MPDGLVAVPGDEVDALTAALALEPLAMLPGIAGQRPLDRFQLGRGQRPDVDELLCLELRCLHAGIVAGALGVVLGLFAAELLSIGATRLELLVPGHAVDRVGDDEA